jgi:hypothetical protein
MAINTRLVLQPEKVFLSRGLNPKSTGGCEKHEAQENNHERR